MSDSTVVHSRYDFKGVIDYVFYSKLHMNVLGVLGPIDSSWLEENHIHGCPHPHVPSDHFPIVVELQLHSHTHTIHPPNGINMHRQQQLLDRNHHPIMAGFQALHNSPSQCFPHSLFGRNVMPYSDSKLIPVLFLLKLIKGTYCIL